MEHEEVKHKAVRGIIALTGRTMFLQLVNGLALLVLQGILNASQIGVYIVVASVIRIFNLFTDVGLGAALIQKRDDLTHEDLKVAFTMQEVLVLGAIILGVVFTPQVQRWANLDGDGIFLYRVLLLILFISSLKAIPSILLERRLAFERQILPQILEAIVFNILVVALAIKGFGVRSYSWAFLISALAGLPVYYLISPWKISLGFSKNIAKKLLSYGVAYQGKSFLAVVKDDLLTFFLSGLVGTTGVGFWGTAQRWAYFPYRFIVDSVTKVTFPAYSRFQEHQEFLRQSMEKSLFAVSLVLFPILILASFSVAPLIHIFPRYLKWEPALISFYFLCAQAGIAGLTNILVNVLDAVGHVRTTLGLMIFWIIGTWVLTIIAVSRYGFTGIAIAAFVVSLSIFLVIYLVKKVVRFNFVGSIWQPVISCLIMGVALYLFYTAVPAKLTNVVLGTSLGAIIYLGAIFLLAKNEVISSLQAVFKVYRKEL